MAFGIVLLSICAVVLLYLVPSSRYGLPLFFLILGLILATASVLFQYYSSSSYNPPVYVPLRGIDMFLYRYIGGRFKLPMPYMQYMRNIGIVIYMFGISLFLEVIKRNRRIAKQHNLLFGGLLRKLLCLVWFLLYLHFYSPGNAYRIYLALHSLSAPHQNRYRQLIHIMHGGFSLLVLTFIFYPLLYLLFQYWKRRITCFSNTIFILVSSLTGMNLYFYITFFVGIFRDKSEDVFRTGFWFFNGIIRIPNPYIVSYPLFAICVLAFILFNLNKLFSSDLLFFSQQRTLKRSINELNQNLKDVFHSEKNLMFSIQILAKEIKNEYGNDKGLEKLERIIEISSQRMNTISESLNRIKELHIKTNALDLRDLTDNTLKDIQIPENVTIIKDYCPFPAMCRVDLYHTSCAITNLLMNSLDALAMSEHANKCIHLTIGASKDWVSFSIRDNGIGMEKKSIKKMMMPFVSTKSKTGNWGIGLPYVFRVINAQLGQLKITSSAKKNHHFTQVEILLPTNRRIKHEQNSSTSS